jgi:hypothetical protein
MIVKMKALGDKVSSELKEQIKELERAKELAVPKIYHSKRKHYMSWHGKGRG